MESRGQVWKFGASFSGTMKVPSNPWPTFQQVVFPVVLFYTFGNKRLTRRYFVGSSSPGNS